MNQEKIKQAVRLFLEGIGEDSAREGLLETPDRVARMCEEIFSGYQEQAADHLSVQFLSQSGRQIILEKDIAFYSICEHHLLPFFGKAHIAYIPGGKVAGLSKLARTVDVYAKRLQIQERMTGQIAEAVKSCLNAAAVLVVVEAEHTCMTMRGIKKMGSRTMTIAAEGAFFNDAAQQSLILSMIKDQ